MNTLLKRDNKRKMSTSLKTNTLLLLALLLLGARAQQIVADKNSYCEGVTFDRFTMSASDLKGHRDHTYTDFYSDYNQLFNFVSNPNSNNFIKLMRWQFGLLITLVLLIVISFIIFFVFCCINRRLCPLSCWQPCFWLFVILFLCFLGLYIAILVFIGISQHHAKPAYCAVYSAPVTFLYGNPGAVHRQEFIGYRPMQYLVGNFSNELSNLPTVTTNAAAIVGADLRSKTLSLIQTDINFWRQAAATANVTGYAQSITPDIIIRNSAAGPFALESDFGTIDGLARDLYTTASEIKFMGSSWYVSDTRQAMATLKNQLDSTVNSYDSLANSFTYRAMQIQSYAIGGFWTFFAISIVILILCIIVMIIVCCNWRERKCVSARRWVLILLIVIAFFAIVYGICVLILMAGVSGASSFCRFVAELNQGGWNAVKTFETYLTVNGTQGLNSTNPGTLVKGCFFKNSTGYIPSLFNSTSFVSNQYDRLINIVNGLTTYRNYMKINPNFQSNTSPGYANLTYVINVLSAGDLYDNTRIYDGNKQINNYVSCSSNQYALTSAGCNNYFWSSCSAFPSGFTVPSCSSNAGFVSTSYGHINNYIASERAFLSSLLTNSTVLSAAYQSTIAAFSGQNSNIQAINTALPLTMNTTKAYNNTLSQITNCNNLQVEMIQMERYACFPFVKPLYVLVVLACVSTLILFLLLWALWAAWSAWEEHVVVVTETTTVTPRGNVMVGREEFLAVSEQELVPKY